MSYTFFLAQINSLINIIYKIITHFFGKQNTRKFIFAYVHIFFLVFCWVNSYVQPPGNPSLGISAILKLVKKQNI